MCRIPYTSNRTNRLIRLTFSTSLICVLAVAIHKEYTQYAYIHISESCGVLRSLCCDCTVKSTLSWQRLSIFISIQPKQKELLSSNVCQTAAGKGFNVNSEENCSILKMKSHVFEYIYCVCHCLCVKK